MGYVYFLILIMYLYNVMCFLCFSLLVLGDVPINVFEPLNPRVRVRVWIRVRIRVQNLICNK